MSTKPPITYNSLPIPTTPTSIFPPNPISRAASMIRTRSPWQEFFNPSALSFPYSYADSTSRMRLNAIYFRVNYTMVILVILFLSLVYHPLSMIMFLLVLVCWLWHYYFRDDPVVLMGRVMSDGVVLGFLSLVTVVVLVFTGVGVNVLVGLCVGVGVVGLHAAVRGTDDLFLDESEAAENGLVSVVGGERLGRNYNVSF